MTSGRHNATISAERDQAADNRDDEDQMNVDRHQAAPDKRHDAGAQV